VRGNDLAEKHIVPADATLYDIPYDAICDRNAAVPQEQSPKKSRPFDRHVGARIRLRRGMLGA
jgi:hypothetical protein